MLWPRPPLGRLRRGLARAQVHRRHPRPQALLPSHRIADREKHTRSSPRAIAEDQSDPMSAVTIARAASIAHIAPPAPRNGGQPRPSPAIAQNDTGPRRALLGRIHPPYNCMGTRTIVWEFLKPVTGRGPGSDNMIRHGGAHRSRTTRRITCGTTAETPPTAGTSRFRHSCTSSGPVSVTPANGMGMRPQ
eukprot:COSAG03_NODE_14_length_22296_cov_10.813128_18_plen_190_part_00